MGEHEFLLFISISRSRARSEVKLRKKFSESSFEPSVHMYFNCAYITAGGALLWPLCYNKEVRSVHEENVPSYFEERVDGFVG